MSHATRRLSLFAAALCLLTATDAAAASDKRAGPRARTTVELKGVLNLNTANEAQLSLLPGVGASKARLIVEQRTKRRFTSTDQVMKVKGIGKKTYRKLKPHLAVSGETTLVRSRVPAKEQLGTAPAIARHPVKAAGRRVR